MERLIQTNWLLSPTEINWVGPLPVGLPLLVAAMLVGFAPVCRRRWTDAVSIGTAATVTMACLWLAVRSSTNPIVYWFGSWLPRGHAAIGISFVIDPIGGGMAAFCGFLMTMALLYSAEYFEAIRTYFHALMLLFLAAMAGFCLTGDLFNLFVFFELMSVTAYALTSYKVEEQQAPAGAFNFAVSNSVGGFMVLMGIGLVYGRTGALNMAQAGESLAKHPSDGLLWMALTLIFSGFFIKAAVAPFHFWLADAHAVAPSPVCVLFSGVMIELGLYGAFRVYWTVFHPATAYAEARIRVVLLTLGAFTAILGAIMCYGQRHLKRMLAFSSISHIGIMLMGAGCLTAEGLAGAGLYVLGHGLVKGALFMGAGVLLARLGAVDEVKLSHQGRRYWPLGLMFVIGGLGLAGFPPFGPYLGKQVMEEAGRAAGQSWLTWVFYIASMLTGGAVLRFAGIVFFGWGTPLGESKSPTRPDQCETKNKSRAPLLMLSVAGTLVVTPICMVIAGNSLGNAVQAAAERFVDEPAYVQTVLDGRPAGRTHSSKSAGPTKSGIIGGTLAAIGAALFAVLGLFGRRIPKAIQVPARSFLETILGRLNRIHTGHVGDLVVWLMVGVAAIGVALAMK